MELLDKIKQRRTIRKYTDQKVEREKLEKIIEAGLNAPNAGGGQGVTFLILEDAQLIHEIGVVNANMENRNWGGRSVSDSQPSIIDDLSIQSGFYGCQALAIACVSKERAAMVNVIGTAFCGLENMVMEAHELGIGTCIVGRAQATFEQPGMQDYLTKWGLPENLTPIMFLCMGYLDGEYPPYKARKENRVIYVKGE